MIDPQDNFLLIMICQVRLWSNVVAEIINFRQTSIIINLVKKNQCEEFAEVFQSWSQSLMWTLIMHYTGLCPIIL